jgi:hypothetical protein
MKAVAQGITLGRVFRGEDVAAFVSTWLVLTPTT